MVVDPSADLVQPGGGLLAQRPHQPARPRHLHAGQPARHVNTGPTNPAARPQPRAGPSTSRLTAQPSRHPPGPATSTVGGTAPCQVPQVGARGSRSSARWASAARWQVGSRSSRGAGPASRLAPLPRPALCRGRRRRGPGPAAGRAGPGAGCPATHRAGQCRRPATRRSRSSLVGRGKGAWWIQTVVAAPAPTYPSTRGGGGRYPFLVGLLPRCGLGLKSGLGCRQGGEPARAARPLRPLCTAVPVVPALRRRLGKVISTAPTGPGVGDPQQRRYRPQRTKRLPAGRLQ